MFCFAPQPGHSARSLPFPFSAAGSAALTCFLAIRFPALHMVQGLPSIMPPEQAHLATAGSAALSALGFFFSGLGIFSAFARRASSRAAAFQLPCLERIRIAARRTASASGIG